MRSIREKTRKTIVILALSLIVIAGISLALKIGIQKARSSSEGNLHGWKPISGNWSAYANVFSNSHYGRGDMLIAQHSRGNNYRISADVRFDLLFTETHYGDAGLIIRATDPEPGVDSYRGYYAGLRPDSQTLVLGRASYDWHILKEAKLSAPVSPGQWYHLELAAQGCQLTVLATPDLKTAGTSIEYQDTQCLSEGVAGLRSFYAQASWRNVKITSY